MRQTAKRPDQAHNKRPTLGHAIQSKTSTRYRQGYHYQPIPSTSQQSPTFVLESREYPPHQHTKSHHHNDEIIDGGAAVVPIAGPSHRSSDTTNQQQPPSHQRSAALPTSSSADVICVAVA